MITEKELKFQQPKEPFMSSSTSEVYRGQYHGFEVAIKRYLDPVKTSPRYQRRTPQRLQPLISAPSSQRGALHLPQGGGDHEAL